MVRVGVAMVIAVLVAWASPAAGVIKVDMPVSRIYATGNPVLVGKVTGVKAENRVVDVEVAEVLKGQFGAKSLRVQIVQPEQLIAKVAVGQPVVVFVGRAVPGGAAPVTLHLADTWLLAEVVAGAQPPAFRVMQEKRDQWRSFPGRTAAMVRIVGELKSRKRTLVDQIENKVFRGGVKELGKLKVEKAAYLVAADVNGDKKADLLVGAGGGVRLFINGGGAFADATEAWGLTPAMGARLAVGDVNGDGKADVLVGKTVWMNDGGKFAKGPTIDLADEGNVLALALADVNGDGRADAVALYKTGEVVAFENGGAMDRPWARRAPARLWDEKSGDAATDATFGDWGDDGRLHVMVLRASGVTRYALDGGGGEAADIQRLTGETREGFAKMCPKGLKNARGWAIDIDGDGRLDYLMVGEEGMVMLVNRGFGAYLLNPDVGAAMKGAGEKAAVVLPKAGVACAAAALRGDRFEDLLMLDEGGRLYEAENPPFKAGEGE